MKPSLRVHKPGILIAGIFLLSLALFAPAKTVRLRNGVLLTDPAERIVKSSEASLYAIQFHNPPSSAQRAELEHQGIKLISYISAQTYLARLGKGSDSELAKLAGIKWIQPFSASNKIHPALNQTLAVPVQLRPVSIRVALLLAPDTSASALTETAAQFTTPPRYSTARFGTILRGGISPQQIFQFAQSDNVLWIEPDKSARLHDEIASQIVAGYGGPHLTLAQSLGYDGRGVTVAVADTGLCEGDTNTIHPDLAGRVANMLVYDWSLPDAADENGHGTHVAGIIAGNGATGETNSTGRLYGLGVAPGASLIAQRIFDGDGNLQFYDGYETLTRDAYTNGAIIGNFSWGFDAQGDYDLYAAEFDALVRDAAPDQIDDPLTVGDQQFLIECSVGNFGPIPSPQTIDSPATAKNVLATGASQNNSPGFPTYQDGPEAMAAFSGRGPCIDGRIKPDLVAPGTWIASLKSAAAPAENALLPISPNYEYREGTSMASPQVAGAAAVFIQYYRTNTGGSTPSPALIKAALINAAVDMENTVDTSPTPNMDEGWGRVNVAALVQPDRRFKFLDQTVLLTDQDAWSTNLIVNSSAHPLKITLAYTDVPGSPYALPALVNDLDLEVVAPDGTIFRGNQFDAAGHSIPNSANADHINNVEGILVPQPVPGEYLVRVYASNIAEDARRDTEATDQDFALVASGNIAAPQESVVLFDRQHYTAPDLVNLRVLDPNRTNELSVTLLINSETEPTGEMVTLTSTVTNGVFTGQIATATGPAVADGILQIADNDTLTATYFEPAAGTNRTATAIADLAPPVITSVTANNAYGRVLISWLTDTLATSTIRYGTNAAMLDQVITDSGFTQNHRLAVDDLIIGLTYYFEVISADVVGNSATNDNFGSLFTFAPQPVAPVLLVDAYVPDAESPYIPLGTYASAIKEAGFAYDVWSALQMNATPTLAELSHYRAVIWRINDSYLSTSPHSTLSPEDQSAISNYVAGGGGFFMASMEVLERIGDVPFRRDVFQVESFITNAVPDENCYDCDEDHGVPAVEGQSGDPLTDNLNLVLDYTNYPEGRFVYPDPYQRDLGDTFGLNPAGTPIFLTDGLVAGMRYEQDNITSTGRVVLLTFPLDAIPSMGPAQNTRGELMRRVLNYLVPGTLAETLKFKFTFDDDGDTTTDSIAGVELNLVNGTTPFDVHSAADTGVGHKGRALDFSSGTYGNIESPLAYTANDPTLHFGIVSNFTITAWVNPTVPLNYGFPRFFSLCPSDGTDDKSVNSLGFENNNGSAHQVFVNTVQNNTGNSTLATNRWSFLAISFNGTSVRYFTGDEGRPATLVSSNLISTTAPNIGETFNLFLGNNNNRNRVFLGMLDDVHFYTTAGDSKFVEQVRQSALPDPYVSDTIITPVNPVSIGAVVTLRAGINSASPILSLVWQSDGGSNGATWTNLPNSSTSTYAINTTGLPPSAAQYRLIVTLDSGAKTNQPASLVLRPPVYISDYGNSPPPVGPQDVAQLETGTEPFPDGLNYYDDNARYPGQTSPGQTFTTGSNPDGYRLNAIYVRTSGLESVGKTNAQTYTLSLYSVYGNEAMLLDSYPTFNQLAFNDEYEGHWLKYYGFTNILQPYTTYAYSHRGSSGYCSMGTASNNHSYYPGGEAVLIPSAGGTMTFGDSHDYDATFVVKLVSATPVNTNPAPLGWDISGGQLTLSWPEDHIGWRLQVQTNPLDIGISTNWVDVGETLETNWVSIPLNVTNGAVFYRMIYP